MNWPYVTRRRHDAEVAELRQQILDAEARFDKCEGKRRNLARWLAEANAANVRVTSRNNELSGRVVTAEKQAKTAGMRMVAAATVTAADEGRPIDGGSPGPASASTRLRRAKAHASALHERLVEVTAANQACTCGGGVS